MPRFRSRIPADKELEETPLFSKIERIETAVKSPPTIPLINRIGKLNGGRCDPKLLTGSAFCQPRLLPTIHPGNQNSMWKG